MSEVLTGSDATEIAAPLLGYLRRAAGDPTLGYEAAPARLAGGHGNAIFAFQLQAAPKPFDKPLVVRIFPPPADLSRARREAAVHRAVTGQGSAAPRVFCVGDAGEGLGGPFLIMERAPGHSMIELVGLSLFLLRMPRLFANTVIALHRLDPEVLLTAIEAAGVDRRIVTSNFRTSAESKVGRYGLSVLAEWLDRHRPTYQKQVMTHGDLHPGNLIVHHGRVSALIDWSSAAVAPPERDLGASRILIGYGEAKDLHGPLRAFLSLVRWWTIRRYEALYRARLPINEELVRYCEVFKAFEILAGIAELRTARALEPDSPHSVTLERLRLEEGNYPWDGPHLPKLLARVAQISGVRVELPHGPLSQV
ncbi:MAG: phosphotransferase [bacterium]|nr:phosphotransferase [bacterium]